MAPTGTVCQRGGALLSLPSQRILARRFARLAALPEPGSLGVRAALLQLWASGVAVALPAPEAFVNRNNKLETKFHRLISKISEEELAAYSLSEMAAQLGCSKQHLSRLFRVELGMSLREKHAELSLQHACQLLLNPGVKISSAANQSGYRYPTFFNALFKKRFRLPDLPSLAQAQFNGAVREHQRTNPPHLNSHDLHDSSHAGRQRGRLCHQERHHGRQDHRPLPARCSRSSVGPSSSPSSAN